MKLEVVDFRRDRNRMSAFLQQVDAEKPDPSSGSIRVPCLNSVFHLFPESLHHQGVAQFLGLWPPFRLVPRLGQFLVSLPSRRHVLEVRINLYLLRLRCLLVLKFLLQGLVGQQCLLRLPVRCCP